MQATMPAPRPARQDVQVISLVALAHSVSHFFHLILAPLFPWIKPAFDLSYAELGLLMSVFFVASGIVQAVSGFLVDRIGARPVLFGGLAMLGASAWVLAYAPSYAMLTVGAALAGVGNGVFHPADYTLLNKRVSAGRLGHAFSMHSLSGTLGWAAAPVFLVSITGLSSWRVALAAAGCLAFGVLALLVWWRGILSDVDLREHLAHHAAPHGSQEHALAFLRLPQVWMCWGFFLISTMALAGIQSFAPSALAQLYGMPLAMATAAVTAYLLGNAAGIITGGFAVGRLGSHDRMIGAAFCLAGLTSILVATGAPPSWLIPVLTAVIGFGAGLATPSRDLLIRAAAPAGATGRVYGAVYSGLDVGFALGPPIFGALMDRHYAGLVFATIGLFQFLAVATAWTVGEGNRRRAGHPA